jgi:hypothetical protein
MSGEEIFRALESEQLTDDEFLRMYDPLEWAAQQSRRDREERAVIERFLAAHEHEPAVRLMRKLLDELDGLRLRV